MSERGPPVTKLQAENALEAPKYDGILLISTPKQRIATTKLASTIQAALKYDPSLETDLAVLPLAGVPAGRLVHAPTGPIDPDYDDIRVFKKTAIKAVQKALRAGIKAPLLVLEPHPDFPNAELVTLLGALEALYVPIQVRESVPEKRSPVSYLGVYTPNPDKTESLIDLALVLEGGRRVSCDIGDADPERMAPERITEYINNIFANTPIQVKIVKDVANFAKDYPLFEAVNRGSQPRHQGRIVFLDYTPEDPSKITETLYLVGKGVTYDTGGADVKINGAMVGMSRDKCGAAAVVGFLYVCHLLRPDNVKVVGAVSLVRNSIGSNSYVADEVITARSGARVRVGNTDAEGRMVMADVLCKLKEEALEAINPHLFTVATLTGHAVLTVGDGFSIVLDNGPAHKANNSVRLQKGGDGIGDLFEISRIRSADFDMHRGESFGDDVKQANNVPSSRTARGHQGPAAFLIMASGLDKHGSGNEKPLKYSHLDIAASAGDFPKPATGAPILALANTYLL